MSCTPVVLNTPVCLSTVTGSALHMSQVLLELHTLCTTNCQQDGGRIFLWLTRSQIQYESSERRAGLQADAALRGSALE